MIQLGIQRLPQKSNVHSLLHHLLIDFYYITHLFFLTLSINQSKLTNFWTAEIGVQSIGDFALMIEGISIENFWSDFCIWYSKMFISISIELQWFSIVLLRLQLYLFHQQFKPWLALVIQMRLLSLLKVQIVLIDSLKL